MSLATSHQRFFSNFLCLWQGGSKLWPWTDVPFEVLQTVSLQTCTTEELLKKWLKHFKTDPQKIRNIFEVLFFLSTSWNIWILYGMQQGGGCLIFWLPKKLHCWPCTRRDKEQEKQAMRAFLCAQPSWKPLEVLEAEWQGILLSS